MNPGVRTTELELTDSQARERLKERLYVTLQVLCWGFVLVMQTVFGLVFAPRPDVGKVAFSAAQVVFSGLLLSHLIRAFVRRRGWKNLNLGPLIPRVLLLSFTTGLAWVTPLWLFQHLVLGWNPPDPNHVTAILIATVLNSSVVFVAWLCLYFLYHIFDRFNRAEVERLRLVASAKNAELRALKSQLNPHFIFNALNSLRSLIDEDPARARTSVTQLANLLRYSLQSAQLETVDFEEELKVVKDYLALEQVRHEERLQVALDVPAETLHWPVPPLLLQTVVENAVKYGISARTEGGRITIVARVEGQALVLRVTNPGEVAAPNGPRNSTGLGLANAAERLRLIFGEKSSLALTSERDNRVLATAVIPRQLSRN